MKVTVTHTRTHEAKPLSGTGKSHLKMCGGGEKNTGHLPTVEGTYLESVYYYSRRYLSRVSVLPTVEGTYLESVYYLQ